MFMSSLKKALNKISFTNSTTKVNEKKAIEEMTEVILNIGLFNQLDIDVIDSILENYYASIDIPIEYFQAKVLREAIDNTKKKQLTKRQSINITWIRDLINERYDKDYNIIKKSRTFRQLFSIIPKNIMPTHIEELKKLNSQMLDTSKSKNTYLSFYPDNEPLLFIASQNESTRCNLCHELHGTMWLNKYEIPNWAKPPLHNGCTCKLIPNSNVTDKILQVNGNTLEGRCVPPSWLKSMQGISNIKKIKGICSFRYRTLVIKTSNK